MQGDCEEVPVEVEIHDVEEGEISDSASVEEITEDDFNAKHAPALPVLPLSTGDNNLQNSYPRSIGLTQNSGAGTGSGTRVWPIRDLYKYQIASTPTYNSGLYNLAWAQAVNNKPLDEVFLMVGDGNNNDNNGGISDGSVSAGNENKDRIDVEDESEKEEGELEEGEIDLDSEVVSNESSGIEFEEVKAGLNENDMQEKKKQLDKIKEELQKLNVADAVGSFSRLCSSIQNSVDSLQEMVIESSCVEKDNLAKLLLTTIRSVESVFLSMDLRLKEQNRDILSRLLVHVTSLKPSLFSLLQLKEMKVIMESVDSSTFSLGDYIDKKKQVDGGHCVSFQNSNYGSECLKETEIYFGCFGSGLDHPKSKGPAVPLIDLHIDHDAENLPSPTRDVAPSLPFDKGFVLGHGSVKPEWPVPRQFLVRDKMINHPNYETDAVEAVSTYQLKFGCSSFFRNDDLPSPTPSEEGHTEDVETSVEVTSSTIRNSGKVNPSLFGEQMVGSLNSWITKQPMLSSALSESLPCQGFSNAGSTGLSSTVPRPVLKYSSSKIRDPRLRLANSTSSSRNLNPWLPSVGISDHKVEHLVPMSSRKQKTVEELVLDGPTLKRPRNDLAGNEISYSQGVTKTEGWLEDRGTIGMHVACGNHILGNTGNSENLLNAVTRACTSSVTHNVTSKGTEKFQIVGQNATFPFTCSVATLPMAATSFSHLNNSKNPSLSRPVTSPLSSQGSLVKDPNATASLHSLLKNIAGNPSMWVDLIKSEHQKSTDSIKSLTQIPNVESILAAQQPTKGASPNLSVLGRESVGVILTQSHTVAAEESGNNRMKPRDPRRFHYNSHQKGGSAGTDQHRTNSSVSSAMTGTLSALMHKDDLDKKSASASNVFQPDISRQFTDNLRNVADMLSVSQASMSPSVLPEITSSQSLKVHKGGMESLNIDSGSLKKVTGVVTEEPVASSPGLSIAWSDVEHLFEGFDDQQKAAIQRERNRRMEEQKKMFAERKLCLVLDLDHTLLNSAKFVEVDPHHDEMLRKKEEDDREKPQRHLFRFPHMGMWTKLRPGIWNFLEKCSELFELHLYTMGNKYYATEMAKLLDPKGDLFSGRVISRGDDGDTLDSEERVPKSKDLEGVLGMESAVVIIDDSVRVWPHNKLNLIVVERYIYFPCSRRQFGLPGPSLLEIDHDERPEFGTLASSLAVIERIHQNFFAHQSLDEADVRNILASEQRKILAGCRVVFSRIFPVDEANPHMHPLWQTAEQFGAVCCNQIDDQVTHVVANSLGTNKVNWAHSTGRFVVHPGWVEASALLYRRANEHDFFIKQQTTT